MQFQAALVWAMQESNATLKHRSAIIEEIGPIAGL